MVDVNSTQLSQLFSAATVTIISAVPANYLRKKEEIR